MKRSGLTLMLVAAIGQLASLGLGQDWSQKITYETKGASVDRIFKDLQEKANVPLGSVASLRSEIMVISVRDVPLQTFLDKIAEAVGGEWHEESSGTRRLAEDPNARYKAVSEDLLKAIKEKQAKLLQGLRKPISTVQDAHSIAALRSPGPKFGSFFITHEIDENGKRGAISTIMNGSVTAAGGSSSGARLADFLLGTLNPYEIGVLTPSMGVTFSTSPNPRQRSFGFDPTQQILEYDLERRLIAQVAPSYSDVATNPLSEGFLGAERVGKVLLTVSSNGKDGYMYQLGVWSPTGMALFAGKYELKIDLAIRPPLNEVDNLTMPLASLGKAFLKYALTPEKFDALLHPEKIEPFTLIAGDILVQFAAKNDKQVVACMGDDALGRIDELRIRDGAVLVRNVMPFLRTVGKVSEDGSWLMVKPNDFFVSRGDRTDRRSLGAFLRDLQARQSLSFDVGAAFFGPRPVRSAEPLLTWFLDRLHLPTKVRGRELMTFWGRLSPRMRQEVITGGVNLASLSYPQVEAMAAMVRPQQTQVRSTSVDGFSQIWTYYEPTEFGPETLPRQSYVRIKVDARDAVFNKSGFADFGLQPSSIVERVAGAEGARISPSISTFRVGQQRQWQVEVSIPGDHTSPKEFLETVIGVGQGSVPFQQLPEWYKQQVYDLVAKYRADARKSK